MDITELTFRLLLLFFPGIISYYIVDALTVHRERRSYEVFLFAYVYGLLSYGLYALGRSLFIVVRGISITADSAEFRAPVPDRIAFAKSLSDSNVPINFAEIGFVTFIAVAFALFLSFAINRKWLFSIAKRFKVSNKFGDPDVWSFVFNSGDVTWATLRDIEQGFMFSGYVRAFSDVEESAELVMTEVIVYNEKTGEELYRADRVYLARAKNNLTIEIPNTPASL